MKQIRHWLTTVAVLLCSITASAYDFQIDGIYYNITSAEELTVEVTCKNINESSGSYSGDVIIPSSVVYGGNTYSVTGIGNYAFYGCSTLTAITIPESITYFGYYVFENCESLGAVYISNLEAWCNIDFWEAVSNPNYIAKDLYLNGELLTEVVIPNTITEIKYSTFLGCSNLTSITIPEGVTHIGSLAFYGCSSLTDVTIPEGVTHIGSSAFYGCSSLTDVTIPEGVTRIANSAFYGCSSLTAVTIPESVDSIGTNAFLYCSNLASIELPDNLEYLGGQAFHTTPWYTSLPDGEIYLYDWFYDYKGEREMPENTTIELKEGTKGICYAAFYNCIGLASITIPESVNVIDSYAFSECKGLTSITIPESVNDIGYYAFENCSNLQSITLPANLQIISEGLFYGCSSLTSITIPEGVTEIGYSAFSDCKGLTSITIPESVNVIDSYAFENCSNLQSITLPAKLQSISSGLFSGCSSLTSITIPESVNVIDSYAFENCSNLQSITLPAKLQSISHGLFSGCSSLTSVTIPKGVTEIYTYAFRDCSSLTAMTLPSTIADIGWSVFENSCKELTCLARTVPSVGGDLGSVETVNVPSSAVSKYKEAYPWSELTILGLSSTIAIHVPSPGQLGYLLLNEVDQWTDVDCLTLSGSLNSDDLALLSRLTEMRTLDLSQTDITTMTGCRGLSKLSTVILPSTVTKISESAFYQCASLNSISLPNVVEVGDYAFYGTALESVELPQAKTIGNYAFAVTNSKYGWGSNLYKIQIPLVTTIGTGAFWGCNLLGDISMPNVKSIGDHAFCNCFSLTKMDLSNVQFIGNAAFYMYYDKYDGGGRSSLTIVNLSDSLTSIPNECFYGCPLTIINFPSALKTIESSAFMYCQLTSITLPEGFQSIRSSAFRYCPLTAISIPSTIEYIHSEAFYDEYSKAPEVRAIYSYAIVPLATTAFDGMASTATLHVPAFSLNAYRLHKNWYNFYITPIENDLDKLHFNQSYNIYEYKGLADKVDMTLAYSARTSYTWESSAPAATAHVTVNANSALTLGEYVQYQDWYNRKSNYDDDSDQYIYTYPYCTSFITQNEITADKMCTNVYMRDGRWNFISFPYDVNVSDIVVPEGVLWVIRRYSGADRAAMTDNTWQNMTDGMVLKAGEGYIFHCYDEEDDEVCVCFPSASNDAGTLFAYDDVVKTLGEYPSEYAHNRSWNLVGNPYPSYFNIQEIEFDAPITVWNGEGYTAYSLLDDSYVLTPNEAFFVQRPINAATMTFHKEGRMHRIDSIESDEDEYHAPSFSRVHKSSVTREVYNFLLADAEYTDRARLVVNEEAKMTYETNCDASKFMSSNTAVPQLYINDGGVRYAINERPMGSGVVDLGAYFGKAGEYTLTLASNPNEEIAVMLTDRLTGTVVDLATSSYTFTAEVGTSDDRFTIALAPTTDIENSVANEAPVSEVYTLDGKQMTDTDNLPTGVYLMKKGNEYVKHVVKK